MGRTVVDHGGIERPKLEDAGDQGGEAGANPDDRRRGQHNDGVAAANLPFATICAMLEDAGYRRHEIAKLSRRYVREVLQHPRDDKGNLKLNASKDDKRQASPADAAVARWNQLRRVLILRNWPLHKVEERIRQMQEAERLAHEQRQREMAEKARANTNASGANAAARRKIPTQPPV